MLVRFFFQAEDGIRDHCVTGVQTCALPISWSYYKLIANIALETESKEFVDHKFYCERKTFDTRSEERRVGKEGRSRWSP